MVALRNTAPRAGEEWLGHWWGGWLVLNVLNETSVLIDVLIRIFIHTDSYVYWCLSVHV